MNKIKNKLKKISIWIGLILVVWGGVHITNTIIELDMVKEAKAKIEVDTRDYRVRQEVLKQAEELMISNKTIRDDYIKLSDDIKTANQKTFEKSVWFARCIEQTKEGELENCKQDLERFADFGNL